MAKAKSTATGGENTDAERRGAIIDALCTVVASSGWQATRLHAIAEEAGIALAVLYRDFDSKEAIYAAFLAQLDEAMLAGTDPVSHGDAPKDRLFDVVMNRFEALRPAKPMLARFWQDGLRLDWPMDPQSILANRRSLVWALEAAGLSTSGIRGQLRILGLAGVILSVMGTFVSDTSEDLSATMAKLDDTLRRSDELARTLRL
jgi:AcrR family transcriptional regulator